MSRVNATLPIIGFLPVTGRFCYVVLDFVDIVCLSRSCFSGRLCGVPKDEISNSLVVALDAELFKDGLSVVFMVLLSLLSS